MIRKSCAMVFLAAVLAVGQNTPNTPAQPDLTDRVGRLEMLADLWGKLWLFHSSIVTTDIDWDQVLLEVIPQVEDAQNVDELVAVLNDELLPPLNDPTLVAYRPSLIGSAEARPLSARQLSENVGYIDATDPRLHSQPDYAARFEQMVAGLGEVEKLVVDLRSSYAFDNAPRAPYLLLNTSWLGIFADRPLEAGSYATRKHDGWNANNSPDLPYHQSWELEPIPRSQHPIAISPSGTRFEGEVLILVNNATYRVFQSVLDALQASGAAAIAWEQSGPFPQVDPGGYTAILDYGGFEVAFEGPALVSRSGGLGLRADFVFSDAITEQAMLEMAAQLPRATTKLPAFTGEMRFPSAEPPTERELSREERLLGLFKIWIVTKYFFPHLDFADIEWDSMLQDWIPRVESAGTADYFSDVLRRLVAKLNDAHIYIESPFPSPPEYTTPLLVWPVENKFVVVAVDKWDDAIDIAPGDEVIALDGVSVEEIKKRRPELFSSSSEQSTQRLWRTALNGPQGVLQVSLSRDGRVWTIEVPRGRQRRPKVAAIYKGVQFEKLPGGIGYINLSAIQEGDVLDRAFASLRDSDGLIFDLREPINSKPDFRVWFTEQLAAHPFTPSMAEFLVVTAYDSPPTVVRRVGVRQPLPGGNPYRKPVVVLIGSWVQSYWEGVEMLLKEIDNVTLVGAVTPGTNGNITQVPLPGGGTYTFTGMRVLNADGSRFQNIGVIPDVEAYPTVEGIREGRDEVLEKGMEVLRQLIADAEESGN